jgi:hypothetical protein
MTFEKLFEMTLAIALQNRVAQYVDRRLTHRLTFGKPPYAAGGTLGVWNSIDLSAIDEAGDFAEEEIER